MGQKKTEKTKTRIRAVSPKQSKRLRELHVLVEKLRALSGNRSELNGEAPDWQSDYKTDPHHIKGREGDNLLSVFTIIMLTRNQHKFEQAHATFERQEFLLALVKQIRIKQGFKAEIV